MRRLLRRPTEGIRLPACTRALHSISVTAQDKMAAGPRHNRHNPRQL